MSSTYTSFGGYSSIFIKLHRRDIGDHSVHGGMYEQYNTYVHTVIVQLKCYRGEDSGQGCSDSSAIFTQSGLACYPQLPARHDN